MRESINELIDRADSCETRWNDGVYLAGKENYETYRQCIAELGKFDVPDEDFKTAIKEAKEFIYQSGKVQFQKNVFIKGLIPFAFGLLAILSGTASSGYSLSWGYYLCVILGALGLISAWIPQYDINAEAIRQRTEAPRIGYLRAVAIRLGLRK